MENQSKSVGELIEDAGDYLETRLDLLKLKAINKSSDAASSIVSGLVTFLIVLFAIILVSIGLSLWVGELLGKSYLGFFVVTGFYLLIALILHFFKDSWVKQPISSMIIKKMLN